MIALLFILCGLQNPLSVNKYVVSVNSLSCNFLRMLLLKLYIYIYCDRYVRVLGAFYLRLTGTDVDVYRYLEPLYNDYRKLRRKLADGCKLLSLFLKFI